jgi:enamine deaminase RidA (YjgF/YER057c/UK114 family)
LSNEKEQTVHRRLNPKTIAPPVPAGCFSHAIEVAPNARWLYLSGQAGVRPDGQTPADFAGQAEQTFANIQAILADAGMEVGDLVKLVVYVLRPEDLPELRRIRNQFLGDARPAQTLVRVAGLAVPGWLIEVEAVAARS